MPPHHPLAQHSARRSDSRRGGTRGGQTHLVERLHDVGEVDRGPAWGTGRERGVNCAPYTLKPCAQDGCVFCFEHLSLLER